MFQQVEFIGGDLKLVSLPFSRHARAIAYRNLLRENLDGMSFWPLSMDTSLFAAWGILYQRIAEQMQPSFDPAHLTPESRHRFFVCGEPVLSCDPADPELYIAGLPQVDVLLGMARPTKPDRPSTGQVVISSGDPGCDLMADLLLLFKDQAIPLANRYPFEFLSKLINQTAQRQDPERQKQLQTEADKKRFDQLNAAAALRAHYERQGIPVPADF